MRIYSIFKKPKTNAFILHLLKSESSFLSFIPGRFSFISNTTNFFIHSLNRFVLKKKCLWVAGFLQSGALYATITHDLRREFNQQKSECSKYQRPPRGPSKNF